MKTSLFSLALSLSLFSNLGAPTLASPVIDTNPNQSSEIKLAELKQRLAAIETRLVETKTIDTNNSVDNTSAPSTVSTPVTTNRNSLTNQFTLSPSTAILVSFPSNLVVDVGQGDDYPITLPLFQDIRSASGEVVIPANTPVSLRVKPHKDGAVLVTDSIIINGQIVSLEASSSKIPGRTITRATAQQMARQNSAVYGNLLTSLSGGVGSSVGTQQQLGFLGAGIGIISGLSSPDNVRVVEISAGAVHVLQIN